jgi:hypothetical protein
MMGFLLHYVTSVPLWLNEFVASGKAGQDLNHVLAIFLVRQADLDSDFRRLSVRALDADKIDARAGENEIGGHEIGLAAASPDAHLNALANEIVAESCNGGVGQNAAIGDFRIDLDDFTGLVARAIAFDATVGQLDRM